MTPPHARTAVSPSLQFVKEVSIVATLMVMVSMTFVPTILYESMRISSTFRYALLVSIALRVIGVGAQLAILTVVLKWILAGVLFHLLCVDFFVTVGCDAVPRSKWLPPAHVLSVSACFRFFAAHPSFGWLIQS